MPMSIANFLQDLLVKKIVKIGQYLAKIWTKYDSLLFGATLYDFRPLYCVLVDTGDLKLGPCNQRAVSTKNQ